MGRLARPKVVCGVEGGLDTILRAVFDGGCARRKKKKNTLTQPTRGREMESGGECVYDAYAAGLYTRIKATG